MKINNLLAIFAVIAIVVALINVSVTIIKVSDLKAKMTGYATGAGFVNLSIVQVIDMNMSNASVTWGAGRVLSGNNNATLRTNGRGASTVERGNWSAIYASALELDNIGNVNATLTLQGTLTAAQLFRSASSTNQMYQWNISQRLANSCSGGNFSTIGGKYGNVNTTAQTICDDFNYANGANSLFIDIWLTVPQDSQNTSTIISDTITATGSAT